MCWKTHVEVRKPEFALRGHLLAILAQTQRNGARQSAVYGENVFVWLESARMRANEKTRGAEEHDQGNLHLSTIID